MLVTAALEMKSLFLVLDSSSRLLGCLNWPTWMKWLALPSSLYFTLVSRNLSALAS
ncbi:hypothetical protein D3C78_1738590 [compost metagenome]